jgi:hypothetical protein
VKRDVYIVTQERPVSNKRHESRVVGFVFVGGWENPVTKAEAKYPGMGSFSVHRSRKGFRW